MALAFAQQWGVDVRIGCALLVVLWVVSLVAAMAPPVEAGGILVISPHSDDDVLTAAGLVARAHQQGVPVRVVFMTNGDIQGQSVGYLRQAEAVVAQTWLGTAESDLIFLGYPDAYLDVVFDDYTSPVSAFHTPSGQSTTYGARGLGGTDYHTYRFGAAANYNRPNMVGDLEDILATYLPTHIVVTSEYDIHQDHSTTNRILVQALAGLFPSQPGYNPTVHETIVWAGDYSWPTGPDARTRHSEIAAQAIAPLLWSERESLDVPLAMQTTVYPDNLKYEAIAAHVTQGGTATSIGRFLHRDEFYWPEQYRGTNRPPIVDAGDDMTGAEGAVVTLDGSGSVDPDGTSLGYEWTQVDGPPVTLSNPASAHPTFTAPAGLTANTTLAFELKIDDGTLTSFADLVRVNVVAASPAFGPNIAPQASVTVSSAQVENGQDGVKAVDGIVDGQPGDVNREWAAVGTTGAWIQLTWPSPHTIGKVVLYDRINADDWIVGGTLSFSDGSTLPVGPLTNSGSGTACTFASRTVTSVRLTVNAVAAATTATGLAEIEAFEPGVSGSDNAPPVVSAGPDQEVGEGTPVRLDGSGSYDPEGVPLTCCWAQTEGAVVTLSDSMSAEPIFTAPSAIVDHAELLTFRLSAHDGNTSGAPDAVSVTVYAASTARENIAPAASVTASSQSAQTSELATNVVDTVVDGWPGDCTREWASLGECAGAWIQLNWATPQTVDRIQLYDRPNGDDRILSGTLSFSDGSTLPVGPLNDAGFAVHYPFTPKSITYVRFTVDSVSPTTFNIGLSEFEVFSAPPRLSVPRTERRHDS